MVLTRETTDDEEEQEENIRITPEITQNARIGLRDVPVDEFYLFLHNQLASFKKTWFYYMIKIKGQQYLSSNDDYDFTLYVTPKNVYNYCKSLVHYTSPNGKYLEIPRLWYSLKPELLELVLIRMLDIADPVQNNWEQLNWFNINNYIRRFYAVSYYDARLLSINKSIHTMIRTQLVDIIFESLIYHGLLSEFRPNSSITDDSLIRGDKKTYRHKQMKEQYFTGQNLKKYSNHAYYFMTGGTYGELQPLKSRDYPAPNHEKSYFEFLASDQIWTFTYAVNWVNQINTYHHYLNNRVIYITGSTGVGKSTQMPKLLMYSQKMLDYNPRGKIICSQPRIPPTEENADTISRELALPIRSYNKLYDQWTYTGNYYVQFKHQKQQHTIKGMDSFLRIVTDGTLYVEMKQNPFLTRSVPDPYAVDTNGRPVTWAKTFAAGNIYDIIIVDEAHEHNSNMDMILTLARDMLYVNNSLKLVIISATMDEDELIYRRYYRNINDNRMYPLSAFIENNILDRANMDRRIHISPPGATTQFVIKDHYLSKTESNLINDKNFVDAGIKKMVEVANSTTQGDMLLFLTGVAEIKKAVAAINSQTAANVIALGYYGELSEEAKATVIKIHQTLPLYTRFKEDAFLEEKDVTRRVPAGTYNRAIVIATNIAEASITLQTLRFVVDTGYARTNIYDPLEGVSKLKILPISRSSSVQRRGRVGRVAPGDVYYLYDKEKIINNKTAYKFADEDIRDHIVSLLKSEPSDTFIITNDNDINNISILQELVRLKQSRQFDPEDLIYDVLKNPRPYIDIIKKQYLYIPDLTDINQYYTYYGKTDMRDYSLEDLRHNFIKYVTNNHDDYDYQEHLNFLSRAYTGYDDFILADQPLSFYLIHPDENIINRNPFTGKMISIKCSPTVDDEYYYYLLRLNNIMFTKEDVSKCRFREINFNEFTFPKYNLAIDDAKLQLLVMDIPESAINTDIRFTGSTNDIINNNIARFYSSAARYFSRDYVTVRSSILTNLAAIQRLTSLTILNDINNLQWYAYAIPYDLESDVLAMIVLINTIPDIKQWIGSVRSRRDIERFFNMHLNRQGDIYFVWTIWSEIKEALQNQNLFDMASINTNLESRFKQYKDQYLRGSKIPFEEFVVLDKMYHAGELGTIDDFYYYVSGASADAKSMIEKSDIRRSLEIIAKNHKFNSEKLVDFVVEYLGMLFTQNKQRWMQQYQLDRGLYDAPEVDIIEWAKKKLALPGINSNPNYQPTAWDRILESYIRAFSTNLMKYNGKSYLKINKGFRMDPIYWSKGLPLEKTFLTNKTDFIIYHNTDTVQDDVYPAYLTPVKLEWVLELNPIYYYYFFFDPNNLLYKIDDDDDVRQAVNIINSNKHLFNVSTLIAYLDKLDNTEYIRNIKNEIYRRKT